MDMILNSADNLGTPFMPLMIRRDKHEDVVAIRA
jgi:hypothetical protein